MQIEKEHFLDASEQDAEGFYDYYYEGDLYLVTVGGQTYKCRSYTDTSEQLSYLTCNDKTFATIPYDAPAFNECIRHFYNALGFRSFLVFTSNTNDTLYDAVDLNRINLA